MSAHVHEIRDFDLARRFCIQSLWVARVLPAAAERVSAILDWSLEIADSGEPLPPLGFVADIGQLVFQAEAWHRPEVALPPGWPPGLARLYEDHVLGRLDHDSSFERAVDALRRCEGRDRARGLAFVVSQMRACAGFGGAVVGPAVVKSLREEPADQLISNGWQSMIEDGPLPLLIALYEELVHRVRNSARLLGPEDIFELEHGTALAAFSQRVALRQLLQATAALETQLPPERPRSLNRRHEVTTRILDEDIYPVGGFASISNRGTIESLLHSQLAYMETFERPDLFDIKFLRDELSYYSRDENQFRRQRRSFVFALDPSLERARCKDAELPWQRIVLVLGLMLASVHKLIEWLSTDALVFEFLFLGGDAAESALTAEQALLETLLREQIANGTVVIGRLPQTRLPYHCVQQARRSRCHALVAAMSDQRIEIEGVELGRLVVSDPCPKVANKRDQEPEGPEAENALGAWTMVLETWLRTCL